jgi:hypothetical protein
MEYLILSNGWRAWSEKGKYYIEVIPIENSIFKSYKTVEIPKEIFKAISYGETNVKELFNRYNLHNYIIQWSDETHLRMEEPKNSKDKYFGNGWFVEIKNDKFFIQYMSAAQGGANIRREISKKAFNEARTGKYNLTELVKKYNL